MKMTIDINIENSAQNNYRKLIPIQLKFETRDASPLPFRMQNSFFSARDRSIKICEAKRALCVHFSNLLPLTPEQPLRGATGLSRSRDATSDREGFDPPFFPP